MPPSPPKVSPDPLPGNEPAPTTPGAGSPALYPFAPLAEAMGLSLNAAGVALGLAGRTQQQYRHQGMTEKVADRMAVKAGFHPFTIWPDMADHAEQARRERINAQERARYHRNAAKRAQRLASRRTYYAENRDYELAQRRRLYLENDGAAQKRDQRARKAGAA